MAIHKKVVNNYNNGGGAVYGLGVLGALIYYLTHTTSFLDGLWGVVQAILWPAFLVYHLLNFLSL